MNPATYRQLRERVPYANSNLASIGILILNLFLAVGALGLYLDGHAWSYFIALLLFSVQFNHAYLIMHECGHNTFFSDKRANLVIGHLVSIVSFLPFFARKYEHFQHHRSSGSFKEPSTQRALRTFNAANPLVLKAMRFCWKFWIPLFAINEHLQIWKSALFPASSLDRRKQRENRLSAWFLLSVYGMLLATIPHGGRVALSILPALLLYFFWIEFFNLPHHIDADIADIEPPIPLWEQWRSTKSCAPMPVLGSILLLNFNFHVVHHLLPLVPWNQLKVANAILLELEPRFGIVQSEWRENLAMRAQPLDVVFDKYIRHRAQHVLL